MDQAENRKRLMGTIMKMTNRKSERHTDNHGTLIIKRDEVPIASNHLWIKEKVRKPNPRDVQQLMRKQWTAYPTAPNLLHPQPRSPANKVEATFKVKCTTLVRIYSIFSSLAPVTWRMYTSMPWYMRFHGTASITGPLCPLNSQASSAFDLVPR